MKIEHPRANPRENVVGPDNVTGGLSRPSAKAAEARETDAVRLSGDLQLAARAVQAVAAGDDRSQAVADARALLERGDLGVDADEIADRMIDALLHSHDSDS